MDSIHRFLAHAIRLEAAAAGRFDELADIMQTHGNGEVEAFFRQMADYSRLHLAEALKRGGFRHVSELPVEGYDWPDGEPPEAPPWWGVDAFMDVPAALACALESERRGLAFYEGVATISTDEKVKAMAHAFAGEEREHVAEIEARIARLDGTPATF